MNELVNPTTCGSYISHKEHTYRTGFLWLDKIYCSGSDDHVFRTTTNPNFYMAPEAQPHKHFFKFDSEESNAARMMWVCVDCPLEATCGAVRHQWTSMITGKKILEADQTWPN